MKFTDVTAVDAATATDAPLARVIQLRPLLDERARRRHAHEWFVVGDESDDFGRVREYACRGCGAVRYA